MLYSTIAKYIANVQKTSDKVVENSWFRLQHKPCLPNVLHIVQGGVCMS